jgi:hypothetical protein
VGLDLELVEAIVNFPLEAWWCFAFVLGVWTLNWWKQLPIFLLKNGVVCSCSGGLDFELVKAVADFHFRGWNYYFALVFGGSGTHNSLNSFHSRPSLPCISNTLTYWNNFIEFQWVC